MTYEEAPQGAFLIFVPWDTGGTLLKMKWQQTAAHHGDSTWCFLED